METRELKFNPEEQIYLYESFENTGEYNNCDKINIFIRKNYISIIGIIFFLSYGILFYIFFIKN